MESFNETQFRQKISKALTSIRKILENARNPTYAADVPHKYDDKFGLAEFLTNTALAAHLNALAELGLDQAKLAKLVEWAKDRSVTLRLTRMHTCDYLREETREVESASKNVTEVKTNFGKKTTITNKVITKVTEHFWKFTFDYELVAYRGTDVKTTVDLLQRKGELELKTSRKSSPHSKRNAFSPIDCNITWMLNQLQLGKGKEDGSTLHFSIDRSQEACRTPRRNPEITRALSFSTSFAGWAATVCGYFRNTLHPVESNSYNMGSINCNAIFVPVAALFEEYVNLAPSPSSSSSSSASSSSSSSNASLVSLPSPMTSVASEVILPVGDVNLFLVEQRRSIGEKKAELQKTFPSQGTRPIDWVECAASAVLLHIGEIAASFRLGIDYIERMLWDQLVAAIGKEVQPVDFANFMRFHNRKLYKRAYEPRPFSYAIRRPAHYPEGELSICELKKDGSMAEPVITTVRQAENPTPMKFALNAASHVQFGGERYLHAYVAQTFGGASASSLRLEARARQFSSFIMLVGTIVSADLFDAKAAIIIQNKDDLKLPLLLEQMPTPKEFRDAIESLSPEQQAFAKAYRSMQLESSLFGVCVIQIKPQLERLLKLPEDCLTKEIELCQDLLELFIKYQVPSDLVTYDGDPEQEVAPSQKVNAVKEYVKTMQALIEKQRKGQLKTAVEDRVMRTVTRDIAPTAPPSRPDFFSFSSAPPPMPCAAPPPMAMACAAPPPAMGGGGPPPPPPSVASASSSLAGAGPPAPSLSSIKQPQAQPQKQQQQQQEEKQPSNEAAAADPELDPNAIDYTQVPVELDRRYGKLDIDNALRPTTIKVDKVWSKTSQTSLLTDPTTSSLNTDQQKKERDRAFDLLDALSRSGCLPIEAAELHIVVAATHCFAKTLMNTVIQDNINPIEKVERSSLIIATTIFDKGVEELIKVDQLTRVQEASPVLFEQEDEDEE